MLDSQCSISTRCLHEFKLNLSTVIDSRLRNEDVFFLCIGTDRCTGDSLGPYVGHYLKLLGYDNVFGTIENPVHAENLTETLRKLPPTKRVIAIDATVGASTSIGKVTISNSSMKPGQGVGKDLPEVGDYTLTAVVAPKGISTLATLMNVRLNTIHKLTSMIVSGIVDRFPTSLSRSREILGLSRECSHCKDLPDTFVRTRASLDRMQTTLCSLQDAVDRNPTSRAKS